MKELKEGDKIYSYPNGAWCSPICMGHEYTVDRVTDNEVTLTITPEGYEYRKPHTKTLKKDFVMKWFLEHPLMPPVIPADEDF